jgi:cell division protein FtsZ
MYRAMRSLVDTPRMTMVAVGGGASHGLDAAIKSGRVPAAAVISTDARALELSSAAAKIQIGEQALAGMGTAGDPSAGRAAAAHDIESIRGLFTNQRVALVVACLGGGTGSGATATVLNAAREAGTLTVCVALMPFSFEGATRRKVADEALEGLRSASDVLLVMGNDDLVASTGRPGLAESFQEADRVLGELLSGLWEMCVSPCFVGIDIADLHRLGGDGRGMACFAYGRATGPDAGASAARKLIDSALYSAVSKQTDRLGYALVCVLGGAQLPLRDVEAALAVLNPKFTPQAECQVAVLTRKELGDEVLVLLFCAPPQPVRRPRGARPVARQKESVTDVGMGRRQTKAQAQQAKLRLDASGKRRFKGVRPTILDGEDLDVPTFVRRGIQIREPRS